MKKILYTTLVLVFTIFQHSAKAQICNAATGTTLTEPACGTYSTILLGPGETRNLTVVNTTQYEFNYTAPTNGAAQYTGNVCVASAGQTPVYTYTATGTSVVVGVQGQATPPGNGWAGWGNSTYSATLSYRRKLPTITTTGTMAARCFSGSAQTTTLAYTATTVSPTSYTIDWDAAANTAGLADQTSTAFAFAAGGGTMTGVTIPASLAAATYSGTMTIANAAGCTATQAVSVVINSNPTITTAGTMAARCFSGSAQTTTLAYTATTQSPTSYTIDWNAAANTAGLADQTSTVFAFTAGAGTMTGVTIPASLAAATYSGTMTITNANGCTATQAVSVVINSNPTITTAGTMAARCFSGSAQTTTLAYTATTQSPTSYTIDWNAAANTAGLADQTSTAFAFTAGAGTMTGVTIPASLAAATYSGTMTITNANGCTATQAVSVVINSNPTITTAGTMAARCFSGSAQTTTLAYTATTQSPTSYTIDWDAAANTAGLADQTSTAFAFTAGAGTMTGVTIPASLAAATYSGTMTITNANGCTATQAVSVVINSNPTITTAGTMAARCFSGSAQTTTLAYTATTQSPTSYTIDWDAAANTAGLADQTSTAFAFTAGAGTMTGVTIPASLAAATYSGTMTITNANGCTATQAVSVVINSNPTITTAGTMAARCFSGSAQTTTLAYTATTQSPTSYTIDWNAAANTAGLADQTSTAFAFTAGAGTMTGVTIPASLAAATYSGTMTITNANGCTATQAVSVVIDAYPDLSPAANPSTICDNASASLTSNVSAVWSASSGNFSTPAPTATSSNSFSLDVTGNTQSSLVTITLTNGTCTNSTRQIQVDNLNAITSPPTAICDATASVTINGTVSGVVWSLTAATNITGQAVSSPGQNTTLTVGSVSGTNQFGTYTVNAKNGVCPTQTASIQVDHNTTALAGSDQAQCNSTNFTMAGNNPTLTVAGSVGTWTCFNVCSGVTPASSFNGTTSGVAVGTTTTLKWTVVNGSCSVSDYVDLRNDQQNSISGNGDLCDFPIATSYSYTSTPASSNWSLIPAAPIGGTITSGGSFNPLDVTAPTSVEVVRVIATNGTCSAFIDVNVNNKPGITSSSGALCEGNTRTLTSDLTSGVSWDVSGTNCLGNSCNSGLNGEIFTAPNPGGTSASYTVTAYNGTCATTGNFNVDKGLTLGGFVGTPTPVCDVAATLSLTSSPVGFWSITGGGPGALSNVGIPASSNTFTPANISGSTQNASTNIHIESTNGACVYDKEIRTDNQNSITEVAGTYGICDNASSTTILNGDVAGVAWTFGTSGVVTATTPGQNLVITPVAISGSTQNATTTVTATNGVCPAVTGRSIRVDHNNTIITTSPAPVCDNTTQLIDGDVSGVVWSSASGGSVSTPGEDATFTPTALGVPLSANVVVTATNGVCTPKTITMEVRKASMAPTSLTPTSTVLECVGETATLTANGATLGYGASYKLYSGSCGGTLVASNGTGVFPVTPLVATTYYARVEGCNNTTCQNATVTANAPLDIIPGSGVKTCVYNGTISGDKYLVNSANEALLSIDEGSYDLGNVTATVTTYGSVPAQAGSIQCDAPAPSSGPVGGDELYLPREFDVTTQYTPGGYVTVSLYFTQAELTALANATASASAAYQSCWGTVASDGSNLMLTIEHSPSSYDTRTQGGGLTISAGPWAGTYKATFQVNQFSGFKLHGNGGVNGANGLPVEMIYFEANAINNAFIQLTWATALEVNNDGFYVERSVDGQNWTQLDFVNGHDNSTVQQDYSYNDMDVVPGIRYYYRLLQVDNDGQSVHTGVRTAMLNGEVTFNVMDFVPNPTMNQTNLIVTATKEQSITVDIYDVIGQKVMSSVNQLNKGANSIKFDLSKLAAGTYTAGISAGNETYSKKLIIAR